MVNTSHLGVIHSNTLRNFVYHTKLGNAYDLSIYYYILASYASCLHLTTWDIFKSGLCEFHIIKNIRYKIR